jgi:His/Glu/Gln/Arg/opine family amino acid ABC transporter permease subunit
VDIILDNIGLYRDGLLKTLQICLYAGIGSLVLGTLIATFRVAPFPPLRATGTAWVTVFRNCPLTVVLFFCAFGLPELGIHGAYFWFGVTGLVLYTSAFVCEAVRSGINAVSPGQAEAARAVGLTFLQSLREVGWRWSGEHRRSLRPPRPAHPPTNHRGQHRCGIDVGRAADRRAAAANGSRPADRGEMGTAGQPGEPVFR